MDNPFLGLAQVCSSINEYYQNLLGYKPEQTSLQQVSSQEWNRFTIQIGLNPNSSGIYLPRNQTAIVKDGSPLSLFHEYFGHGLYCEKSLSGMRLVDLEKKLLDEEKQEFSSKKFNLKELQNFRRKNKAFKELEEFEKENLGKYELFAIWTEYLLSKEYGLMDKFEKKYDSLERRDKETIDTVINFSHQYGNLATMYFQGMAKNTSIERVKKILYDIYGEDSIKNSKLILLTGSKKPFSDIDLFASSYYLKSAKNDLLDLIVFDDRDFEKRVELFEVQVTHSIMKGELVLGDIDYLIKKKEQLKHQPITEKAIKHNFKKSIMQKLASEEEKDERLKNLYFSYYQTYLANALALSEGKRIFTKEDLLLYLLKQASVEDEKPPQLKGGSKK